MVSEKCRFLLFKVSKIRRKVFWLNMSKKMNKEYKSRPSRYRKKYFCWSLKSNTKKKPKRDKKECIFCDESLVKSKPSNALLFFNTDYFRQKYFSFSWFASKK